MKIVSILLITLLLEMLPGSYHFSTGFVKVADTIIESKALTIEGNFGNAINGKSFQQDAVSTFNGYQYVAYYNSNRHVCIARRALPDAAWEKIELKDYDFNSNDAHNTISIGICPNDGTIHLAFDHHNDPLRYRVSEKLVATTPDEVAWKPSLFGPVSSELEKGKSISITYPRFWQTPEGGLQFCYRRGGSGRGDRMLVDYNPKTGKWENSRQIDSGQGMFEDALGSSDSRCSYPNGYDYGPQGKLHTTWVWREDSQGSNHDLMYAYSTDQGKTWFNNNGKAFNEPPGVNAPGVKIVDISREYGLMNTHGQTVDSRDRMHVVMWHCTDESLEKAGSKPGEHRWGPPEARRYHHYWRKENGLWQHNELPWIAGDRPKLFAGKNDDLFLIYGTRHDGSFNSMQFSDGDLVIAMASSDTEWNNWHIIHVEQGPFVNEMLGDVYRWKKEGILSVLVQEMPATAHESTALRLLDFSIE
ncbi:MAG: BNR repeat-containing protein [Cyclobacteriaceae bacterium]|nr:BNR repeat-containing protein [Cyclobacteriaceae bacterium]